MLKKTRQKLLRTFTTEELQSEIFRREEEEARLEEEISIPDSIPEFWRAHRNCGWKPMYNSEPEEEYANWIEQWLLPRVREATSLGWMRDSYLIISHPSAQITLKLGDEKLRRKNPEIESLMEMFPTLTDDCFGYKLDNVENVYEENGKEYYLYRGMWALNPYNIYIRGEIVGQKFGI
jgi:hypothetical protein